MARNTISSVGPLIATYADAITSAGMPKTEALPCIIPPGAGDLRNSLGPSIKNLEKDDVIDFAIMALAMAEQRPGGPHATAIKQIIRFLLGHYATTKDLGAGLKVCNNLSLFQNRINKASKKLEDAKDPPHFLIAILDKMIVGTVKSIPVVGQLAGETAEFFVSKLVQTVWSNILAEPITMGLSENKGIASQCAASFNKWMEDYQEAQVKNCSQAETFGGQINSANLCRHQGDVAFDEFANYGKKLGLDKDNLTSLMTLNLQHEVEIDDDLEAANKKTTLKKFYDSTRGIMNYYAGILPILIKASIILSYSSYIKKLDDRFNKLNYQENLKFYESIIEGVQGAKPTLQFGKILPANSTLQHKAAAIIYGYFLKQSYQNKMRPVPEEYAFIFRNQSYLAKHDYIIGTSTQSKKSVKRLGQKTQEAQEGANAFVHHKYGPYSVVNDEAEGYVAQVVLEAESHILQVRSNTNQSVDAAFSNGINNSSDMDKLARLKMVCTVIANEVDFTGTGKTYFLGRESEILIPDVHIQELSDLGWLSTYSKSGGVLLDSTKEKLTNTSSGWKLRYPIGSHGKILSSVLMKADASNKELAMLYVFCIYVVQQVDLMKIALGYDTWKKAQIRLRKVIETLNRT